MKRVRPAIAPVTQPAAEEHDRLDFAALMRVYRAFGRHYLRYWKALTVAFVSLLLGIAAAVLAPWPLKLILDHVVLRRPFEHGLAWLDPMLIHRTGLLLLLLSLAIVVIALLEALFSYLNKFWASSTGDRIAADIRERVFAHLQRLSLSLDESARSGRLVYLFTSDTRMMKNMLVDFPQDFTQRVVTIAVTATMMLVLDWRLGLIALSTTPLVYFLSRHFGSGMKLATRRMREREAELSSVVAENVAAMAVVQAYGREETEGLRFREGNTGSLDAQLKALRLHRLYGRLVDLLVTLSTAAVLYVGARRALAGQIPPGTLVVFAAYLRDIYGSFDKFSLLFLNLARSLVSGERLMDLVEQDVVVKDDPRATAAPPFRGRIEFRDVSFGYHAGHDVLDNVSFVVEPGQTAAVVGHSGAGKSTLIGLLLRFHDPRCGQILIDGHDVRSFTLKSLRDQITILLQDAPLFRRSMAENIAFGRPGASPAEIVAAAEQAEAHAFIQRLPVGYETVMAEGGHDLSGGQRQRVNIARAIVRDTPIVILDEPLVGLDPAAEAGIRTAIGRLTANRTTFIVAHKLATLVGADTLLLLEGGRLVRQGTHAELLRDCPTYRELYELQFRAPRSLSGPQTNGDAVNGHRAPGSIPGGARLGSDT